MTAAPRKPPDNAWKLTIVLALVAAAQTLILAYFQMQTAAAVNKASTVSQAESRVVAEATEEVSAVLKRSDAKQNRQLVDIHTLVNSNMAVQLKLNAVLSRRIANENPEDKEAAKAADLAEKMYEEHERKQDKVDSEQGMRGDRGEFQVAACRSREQEVPGATI